ncbi:uncharacterized protein TNCV_4561291 [Trichonephila clavipes]|nr:uncharacterized protein TNCV_4561291 [Trichonephila clavipes]
MQWLNAVLFVVAVGIVSCDLTCFDAEADRCLKEFSKEVTPSMDDYCRDQVPFIKCISDGSSKCQTTFVKEARRWHEVNVEACKEGTTLNKEIREHADCINKATTSDDIECFSETGEEPKDMRKDKEACQKLKKVEDCLYKKVKADCGRYSALLFLKMYYPMRRVQQKICEERGYL